MRRTNRWSWAGNGWEFHIFWNSWHLGKIVRLNGTMWGYNPYTSYRFGPFDFRRWH
jgi:hypothetical protein